MTWASRSVKLMVVCLVASGCAGTRPAPLGPPGEGGEYCQGSLPRDGILAFGAGEAENRSDFPVTVTKVELVDAIGMRLLGAKAQFGPIDAQESQTVGALSGWPPDFEGHDGLEARFNEAKEIEGSTIAPSIATKPSFVIGVRAEPGGRSGPLRLTYRSGNDEWTWTGSITFRAGDGTSC